jgi:hypothetical protein
MRPEFISKLRVGRVFNRLVSQTGQNVMVHIITFLNVVPNFPKP